MVDIGTWVPLLFFNIVVIFLKKENLFQLLLVSHEKIKGKELND